LTLLTDDPALAWLLRDFHQARVGDPSDTPASTSAVIAPETLGTPPLGGEYVGQGFPLRRSWWPQDLGCHWTTVQLGFDEVPQLDCSALAKWLLYRSNPQPPTEERVVLWLRQDLLGW
jgi:hypothetical protein